ncbi:MAG: gliding motility-associated C-terminal domain-containing protein [Bacteroidota bacterium]
MKKNLAFLLSVLMGGTFANAQSPACPDVNGGPDVTVCGGCTTLNATVQGTVGTSSYTVSSIPYNPFSYTSGTPILIGIDDIWSDTITLPFCFEFFGNTYTKCVIGSNGVISFDINNANQYNTWPIANAVPSTNPPDLLNSIMGPWHDIDPSVGGSIYWQVLGTAPCRTLVVSWTQVPMFSCNNLINTQQTVLYETTNVIDVFIQNKPVCSSWNAGAAIEGIQNATGTVAYVVPGRNFPSVWTATNDAWRFTPSGASNYTLTWFQGTTPIGSNPSVQVCPTATTTYVVQVVNQTCSGPLTVSDTVVVTVGSGNVSVNASAGAPSCSPNSGSAVATATGTGPFSYSWSPGGQTTQTATGLAPGTYTVIVVDQSNGCMATDTVLITSGVPVNLTSSGTNTICAGEQAFVTASASGGTPGYTYSWAPGGFTGSGVLVSPSATTTYTVYVTDAAGCTSSSTGVVITVNPSPNSLFGSNPSSSSPNINVAFTDNSTVTTGSIVSWMWYFGDGATSTLQNPSHSYADPGTYTVCLVVTSSNGCADSTCSDYFVAPVDILVPNVITPNGDGKNDLLVFQNLLFYENCYLQIYNRWGALIYEDVNYRNTWNAANVSDGTYYFVLSVPGLNEPRKGYVQVLRGK